MRVNSSFSMKLLGIALLLLGVFGVAFAGVASTSASPFQQVTGTTTGTAATTGTAVGTGTAMATTTAGTTGTAVGTGTAVSTGTAMATTTAGTTGTAVGTGTAMATTTAVATGTAGMATPQVTVTTVVTTGYDVSPRFATYYQANDGLRLLGFAVSNEMMITATGVVSDEVETFVLPAQYFQKGRIEDQESRGFSGEWRYTYGLLVPELVERGSDMPVSNTDVTYADLQTRVGANMVDPPAGFAGGTLESPDGRNTFIPMSPFLGAAPGYNVPDYFWDYMNSGVFPAGWLHDLGLPISADFEATVVREGDTRNIHMQAFERGVLTYDPEQPAEFFVERGNVGYDYLIEFGIDPDGTGMTGTPVATRTAGATGTAVSTGTAVATGTAVGTGTAVATGTAGGTGTAVSTGTAVGTGTAVATTTAGSTGTAVATGTAANGTASPATTTTAVATTSPVATTTP